MNGMQKLLCGVYPYFVCIKANTSVLGKNFYTYSKMFGHYIYASVLIHFDHSAE